MRSMLRPILSLAILLASGVAHAQTGNVDAQAGTLAQQPADATKKEKERFLQLLDDVQPLARWMTDEPGFVSVLDDVRARIGSASTASLAPLHEFAPHFSQLEATVARMRSRMDAVHAAAELCDPARGDDLFHLYLDALDAEGQREVTAKICERVGAEAGASEPQSPICLGSHLAFLAARAMHDLVVLCDPKLSRASAGGSAEGFDRLHTELAGVNAEVQQSVRKARHELTDAMVAIAGHVSEVSSVNTTAIQTTLRANEDHTFRLEIEKALEAGKAYGSVYLPEANGGQLEAVRAIVIETIGNVRDSGELPNGASAKLAQADEEFHKRHYKKAYQLYSEAYVIAIGLVQR